MPNPKSGTITFDLDRAIREVKSGRVEFKVDKGAIIHVPFGKASFEQAQLAENLASLVDAVNRAKPAGAKGQYLRTLTIATTMGPGIRVDIPARPRRRVRPDRGYHPVAAPPVSRPERHRYQTDGSPQTACARRTRDRAERPS